LEGYSYQPLHPPQSGWGKGILGRDRFDIYPRLGGGFLYDDNVNLRATSPQEDFVTVVSPGVTFILGETTGGGFGAADVGSPSLTIEPGRGVAASRSLVSTSRGLSLDYAAGLSFYAKNSDLNSVDHVARLNVVYPFPRLSLRFEQSMSLLSQNAIDTATRSDYRTYQTMLGAGYAVSDLTSLQAGLNQSITDYEDGIGNKNWSGNASVNYAVTPVLSSGVGFTAGLQETEQAPKQTYEQARLLLGYEINELVRVNASGGLEWRQFEDGGTDGPNFVFDLGGTYAPTARTSFSLSAGRSTQSSGALAGQNYTSTRATISVNQQLFQRLGCSLGISYNDLSYSAADTNVETSRSDSYLSVRFGLGLVLTPRFSLNGYYQFRENDSSEAFGYTNNQVGLFLSWAY
jgi:hypothetical protein